MDNKPLISVIIATYNRGECIKRAIESVLTQTYKNIELIIVDDGSTDRTKEFVQSFLSDPRIHYLKQENKGPSTARNNGIRASKGKYIAVLDSDDFWCDKRKLEKQVDFLEKNREYALVGGGAIEIDRQGKEIMRYLLLENDEDIRKVILLSNTFAHITVVFRRNIWEEVAGYDEKLEGLEDRDLCLKIGKISRLYNLQEFFACYIGHDYKNPSYLAKKYTRRKLLKLNIKLIKKHRHDYPGYSKALLLCWTSFFYSFLPLRQKFHPLSLKLKKKVFGFSVFKKNGKF